MRRLIRARVWDRFPPDLWLAQQKFMFYDPSLYLQRENYYTWHQKWTYAQYSTYNATFCRCQLQNFMLKTQINVFKTILKRLMIKLMPLCVNKRPDLCSLRLLLTVKMICRAMKWCLESLPDLFFFLCDPFVTRVANISYVLNLIMTCPSLKGLTLPPLHF